MADKEVKLVLTAEDNISSVIRKVTEHLGNTGMGQAVTAISTGFLAAQKAMEIASAGFSKVYGVIADGVSEAAEAENMNKRLAMSMAAVGEYTEKSFLEINEWAGALEAATGTSDDAFKNLVALGIQQGMNTETARKAAEAALDLAAATGEDMNTAFRQMSMTLSGTAGKLEKMIPELRGLTKEQLENGDAIDIISKKYAGFAGNAANSFTGATARMNAQIGNVKEAFGRMIAQNPAVIAMIDGIAKGIGKAAEKMDDFSTWAINNSDSIKAMAIAVSTATALVTAYAARNVIATTAQITWNSVTGIGTTIQKAFAFQTVATSSTIQAQAAVEKAATIVKNLFNTSIIKQTVLEKAAQAQFVAGLVIMKTKQGLESALVAVRMMMTTATVKHSAAEAIASTRMAISNAIQKSYAISTGLLTTIKSALTLENLKNTASTIASTAATVAKTIATYALAAGIGIVTIAQKAFNLALTANPIGLAIVAIAGLTAGIYYLYKNLDLVTGAIKVGLGYALQGVSTYLSIFLSGISAVVGIFNSDWAKAIDNVTKKMDTYAENLKKSGHAQMKAAQDAKKSAEVQSTAQMQVASATQGITNKITAQQQELIRLKSEYEKAGEAAKTAFGKLKDLMPRMNLENFQRDAAIWQKNIDDLKTKAESMKANIKVGADSTETKAELDKIEQQIRYAEEANRAIKIKSAIETREATIKEEEIKLNQIKARTISVDQEISAMRLENARSLRDAMVEIETQRLLRQRGLASADQQAGMTAREQATLQANEIELNAYRTGLEARNALSKDMTTQKLLAEREIEMAAFTEKLEAEKTLAVDMELQKQLAIAQAKADSMSSSTGGGADAANDVELIQAQIKQQELARLRSEDLISEQAYQQQLTEMRIQQIQARTETEMMLNQQKQELLGTSPEAMAMALENEKIRSEMELMMLREKLTAEQITEDEFRLMKEEAEMASAERASQIKEQMIQRDIQQNERLKNDWAVTLGKIRLEQEKHGQIMGMIKGIQASKEYGATQNALSDLSSLRSSSDRKAFEAGKAAAIAQSITNTFMAATSAYAAMAGIPIVGPALGVAAAAAAIMAGMNNVAQIKSQKFQGGAHGGIDEVPKSMNNSTFVLKAGERVVQPDQNKELGMAIDKINNGGGTGGGHSIQITIQGNASEDTVSKMKDALIDVLRETSERGVPIIHEKGIVRG